MGASAFTALGTGSDIESAFRAAHQQACYDYGHAGYTGTIAEKDSYVQIDDGRVFTPKDAAELAQQLIDDDDARIADKHGPAGALKLSEPGSWLFFGWASS